MYWWKEFDAAEVEDDFARIADLGLAYVRFFLLWEDFQPEPDTVVAAQLENLRRVLDIAQRHGLRAYPTLLVGNMSDAMWWPRWVYSNQPEESTARQFTGGQVVRRRVGDLYADPGLLQGESLFARVASRAVAGHPALAGWDLANEIDQVRGPANPADGRRWTVTLADALTTPTVTYGAHPISLTTRGLTIPAIAPSLTYLSMHGYPQYSDIARTTLDPEIAPFVTVLTAQLGGKPCLMQEFGVATVGPGESGRWIDDDFLGRPMRTYLAGEEEGAAYIAAVLDRLWQVGALGGLLWDYADYVPALDDRPPFDRAHRERYFGLFRADGTAKPAADRVRSFARELRGGGLAERLGPQGAGRVDLRVDPEAYYTDPRPAYAAAYRSYLERIATPQ